MFAAPKSVSILASRSDHGADYVEAHSAAVSSVLRHIEMRLLTVRASTAPGGQMAAQGAIAAAFAHRINAAAEPHLHTHILLANLGRGHDGRWRAVSGSQWKVARSALEALYQLELRYQIATAGLGNQWRLRSDGFADVALVPRAAVRAASAQSRAVATAGWFKARMDARPRAWKELVAAGGFRSRRGSSGERRGRRAGC